MVEENGNKGDGTELFKSRFSVARSPKSIPLFRLTDPNGGSAMHSTLVPLFFDQLVYLQEISFAIYGFGEIDACRKIGSIPGHFLLPFIL